MQTDDHTSAVKRRVALIGIPDDALDVLNHYTQSTDFETVVVVSESYEDYAVRMAEILGVPVASTVDQDLLSGCDLVIVGEAVSLTAAEVREMVGGTGVEVTTVNEVTESLGILPFQEVEGEGGTIELAAEDIDSLFDDMGIPGSPPPAPGEPVVAAAADPGYEPAYETAEGPAADEPDAPISADLDTPQPDADPAPGEEPEPEAMAEPVVETYDPPEFEAITEAEVEIVDASAPEAAVEPEVETYDPPEFEAVTEAEVEIVDASALEAAVEPGVETYDPPEFETVTEAEVEIVDASAPEAAVESGMEIVDASPYGAAVEPDAEAAPVPRPETPLEDEGVPEIADDAVSIEEFGIPAATEALPPETENDMHDQDEEAGARNPRLSLGATDPTRESAGALTGSGILPIDGKHDALRALLARVLERTGAKTGSLLVPEPGGERLRFATAVGLPAEIVAETRPKVGEGLAGKAYASGESQVILAEVPDLAEVGNSVRYRLAASVPIVRDDRVIAVLSVNVESNTPIDEAGIQAGLEEHARAGMSAVLEAVDLPRLDLETRRRFLLARLDEIMGASDPFPSRLRAVGDLLRRGVGADYAHVYLVDPLSRRLELVTSTDGLSAGAGKTLSLDRGFLASIARSTRCALLTLPDSDGTTERALAGLPVHAGGPYALVVLEQFEIRAGERDAIEDLLTGILRQLEEIFEVERGVESQDVLSGLKMRIADQSSQLEILPAELRAQAALEFAIQILAAEAAVWLPGPSERPVIAQPQTRQAARIVADVWDELDSVGAWVREQGTTAQGGKGPGWGVDGPQGPSPYVGVKDMRGDGVLLAFFAPGEEGGPPVQLPARILLEALASVAALIPATSGSEEELYGPGVVEREALDQMVVHETRRAQRSSRPFALTRFELEEEPSEEGASGLRRFLIEHKRVVDVFSEIEPGVFIMLSPDTDPDEPGLRERYQGLWEEGGSSATLSIGRCRFPYYEVSTGYPKLVSHPGLDREAA